MSMSEATIKQFMTASPHSIGQDQPLSVAHEMMRTHAIRHLPVLHVGEAMSTETYAVEPRTTMLEVAAEMADHRYGAAVVIDKERLVGIFTTVDGMRLLSTVLADSPRGKA